MYRRLLLLSVPIGLNLIPATVLAQCACSSAQATYASVVPSYTTDYTPAVTYYAPSMPRVAYYAPPAQVGTTYYAPAPYVTYYSPATPQVVYYAPSAQAATTYYAPAADAYTTYYAPAPAVQPYTTYYAPAVEPYVTYYGTLGSSVYGTPKVYVPGEPVRNTLRALTP